MSTVSTVTEGRKMLRQRMPGIMQRLITLPGERHTPLGKYPAFIPEVLQWLRSAGGEP